MGLLSVLATVALFVLGSASSFVPSSAQTVSPLSLPSAYGEGVYLYNPVSATVLSPVSGSTNNQLVMVPLRDFNSTMLWTINPYNEQGSVSISSVAAGVGGCSSGPAFIDAERASPATTTCSFYSTAYDNFYFVPYGKGYHIKPAANDLTCLTIVNSVPTSPTVPCGSSPASVWQVAAISS